MDTGLVEGIRRELAEGDRKEASYDDQFWFYRSVSGGKMQILLTIPNQTIVDALFPTVASSIFVAIIAVLASVVCSVVYSKAISRPIRDLSEEMKTITLNEYSGSTLESREDEIGILQDSFNHMITRNKELIAQQYQAKLEKRNAQLRALQAQINPHFMYNTLQVIGGMALEKDAPEVYSVTLALSDILRYSLNFSKEMVCLEEEVEYLKSYVMIQNERFGGKVQLKLELEPDTRKCLIPKLILQPLAENSFEHGLLNKAGDWLLTVESHTTPEGDLLICIKDNGIGFDSERLAQIREKIELDTVKALNSGSHIGLANVHARIKLRSAKEGHGVSIDSSPETCADAGSVRREEMNMARKVVIIDDEPWTRGVIIKLAQWDRLGLKVVGEAADGETGLELIRKVLPDIVITDVRMPRIGGIELVQKLRSEGFQIPILIISGYDDFAYVRSALKLGVTDYLLKPIKAQELNQQLQRCIEILNQEEIVRPKAVMEAGFFADGWEREYYDIRSKLETALKVGNYEIVRQQMAQLYNVASKHEGEQPPTAVMIGIYYAMLFALQKAYRFCWCK